MQKYSRFCARPYPRVARELFCRDDIHATGIERILAEAGASKMTLYARFCSKEAFLRAVLKQEGANWRDKFFTSIEAAGYDPDVSLGRSSQPLASS